MTDKHQEIFKDMQEKNRIDLARKASRRRIALHGFLTFTAIGLLAWVLYLAGVR